MQNLNDSPSPLSRLINDDNLTILENIIPHCNANLGKFLALCLKISEMQKIMEGFDDNERLSACGFENNSQDIASILRSVRNSVSEEKAHQKGPEAGTQRSLPLRQDEGRRLAQTQIQGVLRQKQLTRRHNGIY